MHAAFLDLHRKLEPTTSSMLLGTSLSFHTLTALLNVAKTRVACIWSTMRMFYPSFPFSPPPTVVCPCLRAYLPTLCSQKCSSQRDRLLLFGEFKPVRLCDDCFKHTPAEVGRIRCAGNIWSGFLLISGGRVCLVLLQLLLRRYYCTCTRLDSPLLPMNWTSLHLS